MNTDTLLEAAAAMREAHGPEHPRHAFWHALAQALETLAARETLTLRSPGSLDLEQAIAIAQAYLDASGG